MGRTISSSTSSCERCVAGSNDRMVSTVSPRNSTRTGRSASGGNRSTMPPRTLTSPFSSTSGTRRYPHCTPYSTSSVSGKSSPTRSRKVAVMNSSWGSTRCSRASAEVTSTGVLTDSRSYSPSIWAATVSLPGDTPSAADTSHAG